MRPKFVSSRSVVKTLALIACGIVAIAVTGQGQAPNVGKNGKRAQKQAKERNAKAKQNKQQKQASAKQESAPPADPIVRWATRISEPPVDSSILGVYTGYYVCSQRYTTMKLAIVPLEAGSLSGVLMFGGANGNGNGYMLKGKYAGQTGAFSLEPGRWLVTAPIGVKALGMEGTYKEDGDQLTARIPAKECTTVELARDANLSAQLQTELASAQQLLQNLPPDAIISGKMPEACFSFLQWTQRAEDEYAGENLYEEQLNVSGPKILNLLEDRHFSKFFGKPYDQFTEPERQRIGTGVLRQCLTSGVLAGRVTWQRGVPGWFTGAGGFSQAMGAVIERRKLRNELQQTFNEIQSIRPDDTGWTRALALESASKRFQVLWPSEVKDLGAALTAAKRRAATPALERQVRSALASANGMSGLRDLEQIPTRYGALFAAADASVVTSLRQEMSAKSATILSGLVSSAATDLDRIPAGVAGLKQGAIWYRELQSAFGQNSERKIQELVSRFSQQRGQLLSSAAPELRRMIQEAKTEAEIESLFRTYLPLPMDQQSARVSELKQVAQARTAALEKQAVLGVSASATRPPGDPAKREPTTEEMYDALQALVSGINANNAETESSCRTEDLRGDPFRAIQCMYLLGGSGGRGGVRVKIVRFQKVGCGKATAAGWTCDYQLGLDYSSLTIPESLRSALKTGEISRKRFVYSNGQWLALSLQ